jgi:hypothetical protein
MTLLSLVSDCIETIHIALYQVWDIISCVSIILRSVVTVIEYTGIKDGTVAENGPFATTVRQAIFVGYQLSDITSELSEAMDELHIRNKVIALNALVGELGLDAVGDIRRDSIIRRWITRYSLDLDVPTKTRTGDGEGGSGGGGGGGGDGGVVQLRSLIDGLPNLDPTTGRTKHKLGVVAGGTTSCVIVNS